MLRQVRLKETLTAGQRGGGENKRRPGGGVGDIQGAVARNYSSQGMREGKKDGDFVYEQR